ncbi:MAG: FAD-binding protein [Saprospiraceae bacterium]|nr:FAD-binding protein [Saprospiraceae bacterium]
MPHIVDIKISPDDLNNDVVIRQQIQNSFSGSLPEQFHYKIIRRNIDARNKRVWFILRIELIEKSDLNPKQRVDYKNVKNAEEVHIIGAGPCGYFAALQLIKNGLKPIILERGKDVKERRRDLRAIQQSGLVNPHSNYCFGEGGAGTYSDGKLYTRSDKRGNIRDVLEVLVTHGASDAILIDVHPHIGSNKLPQIVQNIRETIIHYGGEIHFNHFVEDFRLNAGKLISIWVNGQSLKTKNVILCTGHSARDIFKLLERNKITIECKDFALGVRIEHPQQLIDTIQYKQNPRSLNLPAAAYSLSCQIQNKGVFSFCMCPGGLIVPASTSPGEIVVNGMSLSRRDSPFANSGMVTTVDNKDFEAFKNNKELRGMFFQQSVEQKVFQAGNGTQAAPAQRLMDFMDLKLSSKLPDSSYIPGVLSCELQDILPKPIFKRLREGLRYFGKKIPAYLTNEAILVATESRTSSPVRIPRDPITCQHIEIKNLYPSGEGAGYAGGILSAALDGIRVADSISRNFKSK